MKSVLVDLIIVFIFSVFVTLLIGILILVFEINKTINTEVIPVISDQLISDEVFQATEPVKFTWLGYPIHAIPNPTPDSDQPLVLQVEPNIQIGLRSDGTVIWRVIKKTKETGEVP